MARSRNIKPSFFTNELLGQADPMVCLTFTGLWCLADKVGILEDRPLRIKAELFPYRDGLDVNGYLTVLARLGFIVRYQNSGKKLIQVCNFRKHQSPHHTEKAKGYPFPTDANSLILEGNGYGSVNSQLLDGEDTVAERSDSLIPDSGFTDSLIPDLLIEDSGFTDSKTLCQVGNDSQDGQRGSQQAAVDVDDQLAMDVGSLVEERPEQREARKRETPAMEVFDYWRKRMGHPRAGLDEKRTKVIRRALKDYSVDDLCDAIDGCASTPFNMGENDRGQVYDGLELILRSAEQIDRFIRNKASPPRSKNKHDTNLSNAMSAINEFAMEAPDA